jgi:CBS domain-containing protein
MKPGTRPVLAVVRGGQLEGLISLADIRAIMEEEGLAEAVIASDIMTRDLCTVFEDDTLYAALEEFKRFHHDVIPVLSRGAGRQWLGMLTRQRVYEAVRKQIADVQRSVLSEHAGLAMIHHEGQIAELMLGVAPTHKDRMQRMPVPLQAVGRSLREADFARRFGAQVIAIEDEKGEILCPPDIDIPLRPDYELIAIVFAGPGEAPPT